MLFQGTGTRSNSSWVQLSTTVISGRTASPVASLAF